MTKHALILAAAVAAAFSTSNAMADLTANATAATNYIWRGITQTADNAAVSGGVDWSNDSGLYLGVWGSTFNFTGGGTEGQEVDIYGGYAADMFDVGFITYQYPVSPEFNFTELYVTGTFDIVSVGAYFTVDKASGITGANDDDIYLNASVDLDPVSVWVGSYMYDADSPATPLDYIHYGASYTKDEFTIALEKNDLDAQDLSATRVTISYSKEWEL